MNKRLKTYLWWKLSDIIDELEFESTEIFPDEYRIPGYYDLLQQLFKDIEISWDNYFEGYHKRKNNTEKIN